MNVWAPGMRSHMISCQVKALHFTAQGQLIVSHTTPLRNYYLEKLPNSLLKAYPKYQLRECSVMTRCHPQVAPHVLTQRPLDGTMFPGGENRSGNNGCRQAWLPLPSLSVTHWGILCTPFSLGSVGLEMLVSNEGMFSPNRARLPLNYELQLPLDMLGSLCLWTSSKRGVTVRQVQRALVSRRRKIWHYMKWAGEMLSDPRIPEGLLFEHVKWIWKVQGCVLW